MVISSDTRQSVSHFVSDSVFYLSPCVGNTSHYNCTANSSDCNTKRLSLFSQVEMWFPDIGDKTLLGIEDDFSGWKYYETMKEKMGNSLEWIKNAQASTSLSDIYEYPKGFIKESIRAFVIAHVFTIICAVLTTITIFKRIRKTLRSDQRRPQPLTEIVIQQPHPQSPDQLSEVVIQRPQPSHTPSGMIAGAHTITFARC